MGELKLPIGYYGGAALGLWGAAETGTAVGNAVNEISAGERAAGAVIMSAATAIVVDRATDLAGGKIVRVANAVLPANAKQVLVDAAESAAKKIGLGSADVPGGNGAQAQAPGTQSKVDNASEIGAGSKRAAEMNGEELQNVTDQIHSQKSEISQRMQPTTDTVTPSGKTIVSAAAALPPKTVRTKANELLGDDVEFVRGGKSGNAAGDSGHHAEQRGIKAAGSEANGSKQASSHFACEGCATAQSQAGVKNITGTAAENGGKISRPINCSHDKKDC